MGLPTKIKTWEFNVNILVSATGTLLNTNQNTLLALKNALIDNPSFTTQWSVSGSSNSSAAGLDAVDRWTVGTDLVWGTGAHSWIVLRQTGIDSNFELCIDLSNATSTNATVVVSPSAAFTGGSTTARPTATDEIVLVSNTVWGDSTEGQRRVHVMISSDGQSTRAVVTGGSLNAGTFAFFEKPQNPITPWSTPKSVFGWKGSGSTTTSAARFIEWNDSATARARINGTSASLYMGTPMVVADMLGQRSAGQVAHDVTGLRNFAPITYVSTTSPARGKMGEPYDMYFGDTAVTKGSHANLTGTTREWVFLGDIWIPWNGGAAMAT